MLFYLFVCSLLSSIFFLRFTSEWVSERCIDHTIPNLVGAIFYGGNNRNANGNGVFAAICKITYVHTTQFENTKKIMRIKIMALCVCNITNITLFMCMKNLCSHRFHLVENQDKFKKTKKKRKTQRKYWPGKERRPTDRYDLNHDQKRIKTTTKNQTETKWSQTNLKIR